MFHRVRIQGIPCNGMKFTIWLQTAECAPRLPPRPRPLLTGQDGPLVRHPARPAPAAGSPPTTSTRLPPNWQIFTQFDRLPRIFTLFARQTTRTPTAMSAHPLKQHPARPSPPDSPFSRNDADGPQQQIVLPAEAPWAARIRRLLSLRAGALPDSAQRPERNSPGQGIFGFSPTRSRRRQ